jgi:hypothetical protein
MKNIIFALAALSTVLLFNSSCNESTLVGSDLFKDENIKLEFLDSLTINALNELNDSVFVGNSLIYLPLGKVKDLTFGTSEAGIYTELDSTSSSYSFGGKTIDSVVFVMGYNTKGFYGDTTQTQKLSLYRMTEVLRTGDIYSNQKYAIESTPLSTIEFAPRPSTFINTGGGFTSLVDTVPQVRFKITNPTFIQQLIDTNNYASKDGFRTWLKGFEIRPDKETSCMMNMDFSGNTSSAPKITGLYLYYKVDTTPTVYVFRPTARHNYFKHDYRGATIEPFLGNQKMSDSLLFLQSMSGPNIKLEIPYIKNLGKIIVNKAELELTIKEDGTQYDAFPAVNQILVRTVLQQDISDITGVGINTGDRNANFVSFGGFLKVKNENGEKLSKYIFNISDHFQRILNGSEGSQIVLTPYFKQENASRVVLFGSNKKSKYRAKINLTYTKVN